MFRATRRRYLSIQDTARSSSFFHATAISSLYYQATTRVLHVPRLQPGFSILSGLSCKFSILSGYIQKFFVLSGYSRRPPSSRTAARSSLFSQATIRSFSSPRTTARSYLFFYRLQLEFLHPIILQLVVLFTLGEVLYILRLQPGSSILTCCCQKFLILSVYNKGRFIFSSYSQKLSCSCFFMFS